MLDLVSLKRLVPWKFAFLSADNAMRVSGVLAEPGVPGVSVGGLGYGSVLRKWGARRLEATGHVTNTNDPLQHSSSLTTTSIGPFFHSGRITSAKPSFPRHKQVRNYPDGPHQGSYLIYDASTTLQALQKGSGALPAWQHEVVRRSDSIFFLFAFHLSHENCTDDLLEHRCMLCFALADIAWSLVVDDFLIW